ncbi:hypothetical protein H5154_08240 [Pseudoalteromonas sp. SR44-5]|uniref:Uncharacterized protein n=1 Tax=Pseudoalteromonas rhizosphaerae TaxID=2518973 RepID=A0ABW8L167_9GAMM|nr:MULTISPECIES: hypothetical protein [unclassified Pseudoalteromonas]MBB1333491.1 hypothetical protein [Pseudoalteromonas sp. SR41-6]MBB1342489.1 hypothetical protein [Pseudoalteromonas sp. SR45-6]MBB1366370.1 hypothetical protein [Pseudoalteromonas sp. SR44-5]MBB1417240.1 hypothetical protein [Pseudoalteromonas sp. SG44-1]MBB1421055.1 hypothetical protein [Pseudoalteromonas sp. SG43-7]
METEAMKDNMEKVLTHLESFLCDSEESMFSSKTPEELLVVVSANLASVKSTGYLSSPEQMVNMFLPTASLQEIAMDNGWGSQYVELADHFEQALESCS